MKSKTPLVILAVVVVAVAAFFMTKKSKTEEAYETLSLALDHLAGPGQWTIKDHEAGAFSGVLTVNGLSLKLPAAKVAPAGDAAAAAGPGASAEEAKAAAPAAPAADRTVELATVEIQNGLGRQALEKLLATPNWRDQKELKIADSLVLKGVSHKDTTPAGEAVEMSLDEMSVKSLALAAAGPEAPEGRAGFVKALRLGAVSYKNGRMSVTSDKMNMESRAGAAQIDGLSFTTPPITGLAPLDPSGLLEVCTSITAAKATAQDVMMTFSGGSGQNKAKMSLGVASVEKKDVKGLGHLGGLDMKGFRFDMAPGEGAEKPLMSFALDQVTADGFDMSAYLQKILPAVALAAADPNRAEEAMKGLQTLGDFFVSPFSLNQMTVAGLDLKVADMFTMTIAEAKAEGPYVAGEVPAKQKSFMKGLTVSLPETEPKLTEGGDKDLYEASQALYEFGRNFGMTTFQIEAEGESNYEPATGTWVSRTTKCTVKDLFDSTFSFEMSGLTPERVQTLSGIPLSSAFMVMLAPEAVFGDLSFKNMDLKLTDHGLVDRAFKFAAASGGEEMKNVPPDVLRQAAVSNLQIFMDIRGREYLQNPDVLAKSLAAFLTKPGDLELKLKADPPLNFKSASEAAGDANKILNSLNISVSANGEAAPALKFAIPGFSPSPSAPDDNAGGQEEGDQPAEE